MPHYLGNGQWRKSLSVQEGSGRDGNADKSRKRANVHEGESKRKGAHRHFFFAQNSLGKSS